VYKSLDIKQIFFLSFAVYFLWKRNWNIELFFLKLQCKEKEI